MKYLCEFIANPEWWNVIATFVTAIVAAVITYIFGKRQEKIQQQQLMLQKRQTEVVEYELYKRLAVIIKDIHFEAKFVMLDMNHYFVNKINMLSENNIWRQKVNKCILLYKQLEDCETDLELKFSKGLIDIDAYKWVVMSMSQLSSMFESLLLENKVIQTNQISEQIQKPYIDSVKIIAQRIDTEKRDEFSCLLLNFLNALNGINEDETLLRIKKHSNVDAI